MTEFVLQIIGLGILVGGVIAGYRYWIRPYEPLGWWGRGLLLLIVLTFVGGLIGAPFWWFDVRESFSWDVPPLTSRFLASAGWAFAVLCVLVLNKPTFHRARLVLLLLLVYLAPLAVAIIIFHLDQFDPQAPITYAFFVIVVGMILATFVYLLRQPRILPDADADPSRKKSVQLWFGVVSLVTGLWGLALFVTDSGSLSWVWVWSGDLLSSRLIAVMLLTIATGCIYSLRYPDTARPMLAMLMVYGLGVMVGSLWNALAGKPIPIAYTLVFGVGFLVSAVFYGVGRGKE